MGKITFEPVEALPLDRLVASSANVRRIKAGVRIAELAEDIGRRGLLQSLNVRPVLDADGAETGRYGVVAGGRRHAALQLLVKAKRLARNAAVPCIVRRAGTAEEDSLAENTMREALHPLDQFRAFQALRQDHGLGDEEIAARFFVTPAVVRQRLKLAAVSPKLQALYAEEAMTLEQLMAFSITADQARQEAVWEALSRSYSRDAYAIRRLLNEDSVRGNDKLAVYVGIDAYVAAGGTLERDLFGEDDGGHLRDVALLSRLAEDKLGVDIERVRGEGWLWVEAALELPYGHLSGLRRLRTVVVPPGPEAQAERDRLQAEIEALEAEYATAEDLPDEADWRLADLEQRLGVIDARPQAFDPAEVARAGAFVSIDHAGALQIERGFVRPADEPQPEPSDEVFTTTAEGSAPKRDVAGTGTASGGDVVSTTVTAEPEEDEEDGGRLPERLVTELTAHRTLALRAALSRDPDAALLALLHALALHAFYGGAAETCLEIDARSIGFGAFAPGLNDAVAGRALDEVQERWQGLVPRQARELWPALVALDADSRAALLAVCVGRSLNALVQPWDRRAGAIAHADRLAAHLELDMVRQGGWTPTAGNYLGRVTKARILAAVREARGEAAFERIAHLRKPEMAQAAEVLLAGTGWLPGPLRTPGLTRVTQTTAVESSVGSPAMPLASPTDSDEPASEDGPDADPVFLPHAIAAE